MKIVTVVGVPPQFVRVVTRRVIRDQPLHLWVCQRPGAL